MEAMTSKTVVLILSKVYVHLCIKGQTKRVLRLLNGSYLGRGVGRGGDDPTLKKFFSSTPAVN